MPRRHYDIRVPEIVEVEAEPVARTAVVTVVVRAKGSVEPKEAGGAATVFEGTWRNVMVLERDDTGDWTCRLWVNTRIGVTVETLHHVSVPVTDLERSRRFYSDILGLRERHRPPFDFDGAWYQLGAGQLHLIVHKDRPSPPTFREGKPVDSRDVHFAVRVRSFRETLSFLQSRGYSEDAKDELLHMRVSPAAIAGFPQIYILDPDRHVVELNAERLDDDKLQSEQEGTMLDHVIRSNPEPLPIKGPLEAPSLSTLTTLRSGDGLVMVDLPMICGAVQCMKECFMYSARRFRSDGTQYFDGRTFFLDQFVENQRIFLLAIIGQQMDASGFSAQLAKSIDFFRTYDFKNNGDFHEREARLVADLGISKEDIKNICGLAEDRKGELFEVMSAPDFKARAILAGDPLNWGAFGGALVAANFGALAIPEPLITKGLAIASTFVGLAVALVPS